MNRSNYNKSQLYSKPVWPKQRAEELEMERNISVICLFVCLSD